MSAKAVPFDIPSRILEEVYREARLSFPAECCGWLAGPVDGRKVSTVRQCANAQDSGTHPTTPDRGAETAYVITGDDLLTLNRSFDTDMPAQVIYHSHPNGRAYLSPTDREVATSPWGDGPAYPVQQLVVGLDQHRVVEAALYASSDEDEGFEEIARYEGAAI